MTSELSEHEPEEVSLHDFYGGYFTGPHHPERPWSALSRLEANARLLALQEELTDDG